MRPTKVAAVFCVLPLVGVYMSLGAKPQSDSTKTYPHFRDFTAKTAKKPKPALGASSQKMSPSDSNAVSYMTATFTSEVRAGDCGQKDGTLTIGSDGTVHWDVVNYTYHTHSGDIWHVGFTFLDANGLRIGDTPIHDSPRMNDGNGGPPPAYPWSFDDHYDGSTFGRIASVQEGAAC